MARTRAINPDKFIMIRDAAIELFYKNGIENTSISSIAKAAGVAKGTIYLYFKDREALINDVTRFCFEKHLAYSMRELDKYSTSCGKLKQRIKNILVWSQENKKESAVIRYYYVPVNIYGTKNVFFDKSYDINKSIIQEGITNGEFKSLPIDFVCKIFFSSVEGISSYTRENPDVLKEEILIDKMLDAVIDCIRK